MEKWLPIAGYEGLYEVSSLGRVRSLPHAVKIRVGIRMTTGKILKPRQDRAGYIDVSLSNGAHIAHGKVHRLVAAAFLGQPPSPDAHVNHLDFRKNNNAVENLEWCSPTENHRHATSGGRFDGAVSTKRAKKLTPEIVRQIRVANANGEGGSRILARRFPISPRTIQRILSREIWRRI